MATPITGPRFLSEVETLVKTQGEILVEMRYSHAAGSRALLLFYSFQDFQRHLATLSSQTLVEVYRQYDLPLRGIIDEELVHSALTLRGETEYLIVYLQPRDDYRRAAEYDRGAGWLSSFQEGEGSEELEEDLRDTLGAQAAVGALPEWRTESGNLLWAVVPSADGSVEVGVY